MEAGCITPAHFMADGDGDGAVYLSFYLSFISGILGFISGAPWFYLRIFVLLTHRYLTR